MSILDFPFPGLDPHVWDQDGQLLPDNKTIIMETLALLLSKNNLMDCQNWIEDIKIVGSLTTYQYIANSDLDIHVVVNLPEFIKAQKLQVTNEEAATFLDDLRRTDEFKTLVLPNTKHNVEYFFETEFVNKEGSPRSGVYSLMEDTWISPPISVNSDFDIEEMKPFLVDLANTLAEDIDVSLGNIKRNVKRIEELEDVIKSWPQDQQSKFQDNINKRLETIEQEISDLSIKREKVILDRRNYNPESEQEITFKYLQKFGYLWIMTQLSELLKDDQKITEDEIPHVKEIIEQPKYSCQFNYNILKQANNYNGWISPDGTFYPIILRSHKSYVLAYPELFKLSKDDIIYLEDHDTDVIPEIVGKRNWIRLLVAGKVLYIDSKSLENVKNAENTIFEVLPQISRIVVNSYDDYQNYVATSDDFKTNGFDAFTNTNINSKQAKAEYDYSCVMVDLPKDLCNDIMEWGKNNIPDKEIYEGEGDEKDKYGRENKSHVTVLYGLHTNSSDDIREVIIDVKSIKLKLGKVGFFSKEDKPYDVVIVEVDSKDLHNLNKKLGDNLEFTNEFPEYKPHMTIAYVKKGEAEKYKGKSIPTDKEFEINDVTFSPADGDKSKLELKAAFTPSLVNAPENVDLVKPQDISDEETYNNPAVDKPRKGFWDKFLGLFKKKQSKEKHNTTWKTDEPFKPLSVNLSTTTNEDNLGKYPSRFMKRPTGPSYSNQGEVFDMLVNASGELYFWDKEKITIDELSNRTFNSFSDMLRKQIQDFGNGQFRLVPSAKTAGKIIAAKIHFVGYSGSDPLPPQFNIHIQKVLQDHNVVPVEITRHLENLTKSFQELAESAGRFVAKAKLILDLRGVHGDINKWGISWLVPADEGAKMFLKALNFRVTSQGLNDDDDILLLREFGFSIPSDAQIAEVRKTDKRTVEVNIVKNVEDIKGRILEALSHRDPEVYKELEEWFDLGYTESKPTGITSGAYTNQEMEEIYTEQHEYEDSSGGGNVYHDFSNSSSDFPKSPGTQPVFLDRLVTPPNGIIPSYSVDWASSLTKDDETN